MTLIAGFKAFGVPLLLGDFLLTREKAEGGRTEAGLKKKVRRLRSNCVVAWTGNQFAAERVLQAVAAQLPSGEITRQQLDDCLTHLDVSGLAPLEVTLIGWVVEREEHCFRWKSSYPTEVFCVDSAFDGSGSGLAETIVGRPNVQALPNTGLTPNDLAIQEALFLATRLMSFEAFDPEHRAARGFGHAYEILYWRDNQFEYVDNVLYAIVTLSVNEHETVGPPQLWGNIYKYRALDELSVVDTWDRKSPRSIYLTTALADSESPRRTREFQEQFENTPKRDRQFFGESTYHCLFIQLHSPSFAFMPIIFVQGPGNTDEQKWVLESSTGHFTVRIPKTQVDSMYRAIREHTPGGVPPEAAAT